MGIQVKEAPEDEKIAASGTNVGRVVITIMEKHLVKDTFLVILQVRARQRYGGVDCSDKLKWQIAAQKQNTSENDQLTLATP